MTNISYEERKAVYETAIETWGLESQVWMVIEEMSELQKEICKARRGKNDPDALADEIADVTIMLEQLRLMFDLNGLVCQHMDFKIARLRKRLEQDKPQAGRLKLF